MKKFLKIGLLGWILIAIVAGVLAGLVVPDALARLMATFNGIFSQFLGFYYFVKFKFNLLKINELVNKV